MAQACYAALTSAIPGQTIRRALVGLRAVDQGGLAWPNAARVVGHTMVDTWDDADLMGDLYLFGRMLRLADSRWPVPLLEITGDRTNMRDVQVTLTPFGRDVLEGKASNYPTNPIDDWASGVKLSSADGRVLWFGDGTRLIRVGGPDVPG